MKQAGASVLGVGETADYPVVLANLGGAWRIGVQTDVLGENLVAVFIPNSPKRAVGRGVPRRARPRASRRRLSRRRDGGSQALRHRSRGAAGRTRSGRANLIGLLTKPTHFRSDVRIGERPFALKAACRTSSRLSGDHLRERRCDLVLQPELACCSNVHQVERARTASGRRCRPRIHPVQCNGSIRGLSICRPVRSQARIVPKQGTPKILSRSPATVYLSRDFQL